MFDNLERFEFLELLNASPLERFNVYMKRAYRTKCQRQSSGMMETVGVMNTKTKESVRRTDGRRNEEPSLEAGK